MTLPTSSMGDMRPHNGLPKRFILRRLEDESGVSGVGIVAWGCVFPDGHAALRWNTETASTAVYDSVADLEKIHGHGGRTVIRWVDEEPPEKPTQIGLDGE